MKKKSTRRPGPSKKIGGKPAGKSGGAPRGGRPAAAKQSGAPMRRPADKPAAGKLHGSSGDLERDMDLRQDLLENSLAQVFNAYEAAMADDVLSPVVFLIDVEDEIGNPIAREWEGDQAVDKAIAEHRKSRGGAGENVVTLARAFAFADSKQETPAVFPYLADSFHRPPTDGFLAIVITAGGAGSFTVPFEALTD